MSLKFFVFRSFTFLAEQRDWLTVELLHKNELLRWSLVQTDSVAKLLIARKADLVALTAQRCASLLADYAPALEPDDESTEPIERSLAGRTLYRSSAIG